MSSRMIRFIEAGVTEQKPGPCRRTEVVRRHGVEPDAVRGRLPGNRGDSRAVIVPQPHHCMHAGAGADDLDAVPQVSCTRIEQGLPPRRVAPPAAAEVALEVTLGEEVGQHLLFERWRVIVGEELQRGERLPPAPAAAPCRRGASRGTAPSRTFRT